MRIAGVPRRLQLDVEDPLAFVRARTRVDDDVAFDVPQALLGTVAIRGQQGILEKGIAKILIHKGQENAGRGHDPSQIQFEPPVAQWPVRVGLPVRGQNSVKEVGYPGRIGAGTHCIQQVDVFSLDSFGWVPFQVLDKVLGRVDILGHKVRSGRVRRGEELHRADGEPPGFQVAAFYHDLVAADYVPLAPDRTATQNPESQRRADLAVHVATPL